MDSWGLSLDPEILFGGGDDVNKIYNFLNGSIKMVMAFSLASMAILVFGNVVLRYVFNSGITWSEEMSRFFFIWLIFIGAINALKDNEHLGVDMVVKKLTPGLQKIVYVISNFLILYILYLVLDGSWKMTMLNIESKASATGISLAYIYGIGIIMSVCMAIIVILNTYRALFEKNSLEQLIRAKESEEELLSSAHHQVAEGGGSK